MGKIGIIMGSDSDLPVMSAAAKILDEFKIDYELTVVSAHRTVDKMYEYAKTADERDIDVIIAGAGGAAHLPGMVAAITSVPVIGVPVKSSNLSGLDSLLSIVQMPGGVPVATVAINGAKNAGILAAKIISVKDKAVKETVKKYMADMKEEVETKAEKVEELGYAKYLESM
ncbi:5-(carboxyamino)imidazole ribonucleotide mutase [uncultured Ilyobacter sp.]|jgi:5-(carboxyamino)imidazole ribonucleotide mutase|uniref:5-(carboxyamino)imidazole ribonucleotide mutase n=1 Tax=uncultured Ilyobacter sp. TaxID=544433 RepID=UPI0029C08249|nr:5-(carboxyamino)imidazole ribonucleotide mutase [uncultured Ilyobacter sp.]